MHAKPSNRFSEGPLVQANSANGVAIFTGYDLEPGGSRAARAKLANVGLLTGRFRLVEVDATNDFGEGDLELTIQEASAGGSTIIYQGDIGGVPDGGIDLGRFEPGEERTYHFTAALAVDAPDPRPGQGAGAAYEWEAVPARPAEAGR
jgi:hypothetical protein